MNVRLQKRWTNITIVNHVAISLADGGIRGMERLRNLLNADDNNIFRQESLQTTANIQNRHAGVRRKIRHLPQRMHAGIRAAGTEDAWTITSESFDSGFDAFLHGQAIRLNLPTLIIRPIISDG